VIRPDANNTMTTMKMMILYAVILIAVAMPFLFRRSAGLRVLSAIILCMVASLHFTQLMTMHRVVAEQVANRLAVPPEEKLPADVRLAINSVQKISQTQMWPFAALTGAWFLLALVPAKVCGRASESSASNPVQ
jgi:hypothetical protein